jgi:hypothetical protein
LIYIVRIALHFFPFVYSACCVALLQRIALVCCIALLLRTLSLYTK